MILYHSFPGFLSKTRKNRTQISIEDYEDVGTRILRSILSCGLLLVPEEFPIRPSPFSPRPDKMALVRLRKPIFTLPQKRACFTLSTSDALFEQLRGETESRSHVDLFGQFSIGVNPVYAPILGILPVIYYYDYNFGESDKVRNSISPYLVDRLVEIRNILSILSHIKAVANPEQPYALDRMTLRHMNIMPYNEDKIDRALDSIDRLDARSIFRYFATDRVPMWNLVESIDMLLSLFQTAHSRTRNRALAYYEQREWRLIQYGSRSNRTYSLGNQSWVDSADDERTFEKKNLFLNQLKPLLKYAPFLKNLIHDCWVFEGTEERHFRDYIDEIIVPVACISEVLEMLSEFFPGTGQQWESSLLNSSPEYVVFSKAYGQENWI